VDGGSKSRHADGVATYSSFSKLLGWPALLQSDLERFEYDEGWRLLLEVDQYRNGEKLHGWDPADRSTFFCRRVICA
jgi:hypothetical protein